MWSPEVETPSNLGFTANGCEEGGPHPDLDPKLWEGVIWHREEERGRQLIALFIMAVIGSDEAD